MNVHYPITTYHIKVAWQSCQCYELYIDSEATLFVKQHLMFYDLYDLLIQV